MAFLDVRSYDGTPISRRTTDGYVNATAMCKANNKQWNDYFRTDRATQYLEALSAKTGNPVLGPTGLVVANVGGDHSGTWVHPQVAVDLARWISAPFAVWMDGWFLESTNGKTSVQPEPVAALPNQTLATVAQAIDLLNILGGIDDRQEQILRDVVLQAAVKSGGGGLLPPAAPEEEWISLSEYFIEIGCPAHKATKFATEHGKGVKACYRNDHDGEDPKTAKTFWNGKNIKVAIYPKAWLEEAKENFQELWQKFLK